MIYRNDDYGAIMAMERERTGNYGNDISTPCVCFHCPICNEPIYEDERYYEINENIICDGCIELFERTAEREVAS